MIGDIRTLTARQVLYHLDAIIEQTAGGTVNLIPVLNKYGLPRALFFELVEQRRRLERALDQYIDMDRRGRVILVSSPRMPQTIVPRCPPPPPSNASQSPPPEHRQTEPTDSHPDQPRTYRKHREQLQMYAAVCHLHEKHGLKFAAACSFLHISYGSFQTYRNKFKATPLSPENIQQGIVFIKGQIGDDIPAAEERLRCLRLKIANRIAIHTKPPHPGLPGEEDSDATETAPAARRTWRAKNAIEAVQMREFDFEPGNTEDYEPTSAPPGTREKVDVMDTRAHRGNPSIFHPGDPAIYLDKTRLQQLREAMEDGMKKPADSSGGNGLG